MVYAPAKKSDLGTRTFSAVAMLAVAAGALWLGGWFWGAFVGLIAVGVLWEWWRLISRFETERIPRFLWSAGGVLYVALASGALLKERHDFEGVHGVLLIVGAVIATDIGAYFAGRTIGGPKIAPSISPKKTWAGLFGGMVGATLILPIISRSWFAGLCNVFYPRPVLPLGHFELDGPCSGILGLPPLSYLLVWSLIAGPLIAVLAQAGDFFESWMKRKAGVKDSSNLIPGHGGLFDRVDGLLAVSVVAGVIMLVERFVG